MGKVLRLDSISAIILLSLIAITSAGQVYFDTDDCAACKLDTKSILEGYGYPAEEHNVTTKDGYILTIFRIPYGKNNTRRSSRTPVLAQHGANGVSDNWVMTLDNSNDTFVTRLAESGYDVWISNIRGTRYSHHKLYTRAQNEFWNFTIDEMTDDLGDVCEYVLKTTGYPSISYAGHSFGGLYLTMFLSEHPEYNDKIHYAQLLSPVVYGTTSFFLIKMTPQGRMSLAPYLAKILEFMAKYNLNNPLLTISTPTAELIATICTSNNLAYEVCIRLIGYGIGFDPLTIGHLSRENFAIFAENQCQGISDKQAAQFMQQAAKDDVQKYDYRDKNMEVYGSKSPPKYDLTKIVTNIRMYYPKNDHCLDIPDANRFYNRVINSNISKHLIEDPDFNHYDYFYGSPRFPFLDLAMEDINAFHDSHYIKGPNTPPSQE